MTVQQDWKEEDSSDFVEFGEYFVPDRKTQMDAITSLIPQLQGPAEMLDLCCGQGRLSEALLAAFPQATVVGLDLSPTMLGAAANDLAEYGDRFRTERFDLVEKDWRRRAQAPAAVVSSLAVHHLDASGKQDLFRDVFDMLRPGGVLLIADLVQPVAQRGVALARRMWNEAVRDQSIAGTGGTEPYEKFHALEWSCFEYPDELDKPSPLFDQLGWLRDVGFDEVDAYWMKAGHAIYGGVKPGK
ncbi:class I SAM-dependent methyltransferase [Streptomyces mutabilis]|uniref:class I SAM-dependent methyltransferase n=1 Tax=Streptomyces TaxID=1883 RepID=UPI0036C39A3F